MATRPVKIVKGYPNGNLDLIPANRRDAHAGDSILWQIEHHSGVHSIVAIESKPGQPNIWSSPPAPHGSSGNWRGTISNSAIVGTNYSYLIRWRATASGPILMQDPIIAIRPTGIIIPDKEFIPKKFLSLIIAAVLMITGISLFLKWLKKWKSSDFKMDENDIDY